MRSIEDYIRQTHHCLNDYSYGSDWSVNDQINSFIKEYCAQRGVEMIRVYSSSLTPYTIPRNSKYYLIWDEHFWNFFDYYADILRKELTKTEDREKLRYQSMSLLHLMDASLLDCYPSLARSFAEQYRMMGSCYGDYDHSFQSLERDQFLTQFTYFSRIFVMFHEMAHIRYQNDPKAESGGFRWVKNMLNRLTDYEPWAMPMIYQSVGTVIERLQLIIDSHDSIAVQEFMCDLQAVIQLVEILFLDSGKQSIQDAELAICIATSVNKFTGTISRNVKEWRRLFSLWHESEGTLEFIHNNNVYLSEQAEYSRHMYDDYHLRIGTLYLAFLFHCEEAYDIHYFRFLTDMIFDETSNDQFELDYFQDIIYRERVYYSRFSPEQNLKESRSLLKWNV